MQETIDLESERRRVLKNGVLSAIFSSAVLMVGYLVLPRFMDLPDDSHGALVFAIRASTFVLFWLVIAVRMVSRARLRSAQDISGSAFGSPSPATAIKVAFLQNTLEQVVLTVGAYLVLGTLIKGDSLSLVATSAVLFGIGRIFFFQGYPGGAGSRSFGMVTTMLPTVVGYCWAIYLILITL